ncbi:MAG: ABC transporter substrate-binding protein [Oscillospiraceae bacterium]|nr:ABC transporter substrate-binding protein [Oscillospiraceae bacterium]
MKKFLSLLLVLAMCLSLAACGSGSPSAAPTSNAPAEASGAEAPADNAAPAADAPTIEAEEQEAPPAEEEIAVPTEPVTVTIGSTYPRFVGVFDMAQIANDQIALPAGYLAFDTIIRMEVLDDGTEDYYSDILEDIYVTDDQKSLVMVLKPGVTFSNGEEMDGYDLIWSLQRKGSHPRLMGDYGMFDFENATVDGYTTTIPLNSYRGDWRVVIEAAVVMNKDWIEQNGGDSFDYTNPELVCGSGPYKVTEYVADDHVTYEKRDDWWQKDTASAAVAQPQTIITKSYADSSTMLVDYQNGVLDAILGITETQYTQIQNDPALGTATAKSSKSVVELIMDVDNTPELADVELRKAIAMGTNIDDLLIVGYGALGTRPVGMFAASSQFSSEGYTFDYDPEAAAAKIKELGYEGITLPFICDVGNSGMAEVWQEQMRQIGINIDLQVYDVMTCIQYWLQPGATAFQFQGSENANVPGDPSTLLSNMCQTTDLACMRKENPEWNDIVVRARNGATTEERREIYEEMQQFNLDNAYCVPVVEWLSAYAYGADGVVKDMIMVAPESCNLRRILVG